MDYFKKIERSVTISADKRSTVDLQVDVWSQDLNVTKFILKLDTTDSAAIDLTNATVRVAMVYSQDGKDVKIEAAGIVEDVATQKIAYVMDDKLAGFEGLVIAGFYVTLSTGQRIDIQNVTFNMRKSLLDKDLEAATENYYQTFDDIVADVQQTGDTAKTQIGQVLPDVQAEGEKVKTNINAVVSDVNGYADTQKQAIDNIVSDVQSTGETQKEAISAVLPTVNSYADSQKQVINDIVADVQSVGDTAKGEIKATLPSIQTQVSEIKSGLAVQENISNAKMNVISDIHHGIYKKLYDIRNLYYVSDGTFQSTSSCKGVRYHIVGRYIRLKGELGGDNKGIAQYAWGTVSNWSNTTWTYYTDSKRVDTVLKVPNEEAILYLNTQNIDSIEIEVFGDTKNNSELGIEVTVVSPINENIIPMHQLSRLSGSDARYLTIVRDDLDNNHSTVTIDNTTDSPIEYSIGGGADELLANKVGDKAYLILEYSCDNENAITISSNHISAKLPRNYVFRQGLNVVYGEINNANARVSFGIRVNANQKVTLNITKIAIILDNDNICYDDVERYAMSWGSWVDYKRGIHTIYKNVCDNRAIKSYEGKTWVKYGDSLSALPWGDTIAKKLGMTLINKSIGGTRATYTGSSATNDNAGCATSRLKSLPEKIDVITIAFGANDWSGTGVEIGSLPDHVTVDTELDNTVFIDAMLIILKYICTKYPEATVILITPPFGFGEDNPGNTGRTKIDYGNAIKEIAQRFGCGLVDWYKDMGVNIYNYSQFFNGDDLVHFNVNGQKRMESLVYAEMVRMANICD